MQLDDKDRAVMSWDWAPVSITALEVAKNNVQIQAPR